MTDELKPLEICTCGREIYWDPACGGYWAHFFGPEAGEQPHTPTPTPWDNGGSIDYPDCECGHNEGVHSPSGTSCGDCDCANYMPHD